MMAMIRVVLALAMFGMSSELWALDSYRFLHVTIETPWMIFLVLLPIVLSPFILMAVLYWHFASRRPDYEKDEDEAKDGQND